MDPSSDFSRLSDDEWRELQARADRFAEAIAGGKAVEWGEHLDGLTGHFRQAVLFELIKIDLDAAWKHGRRALLDEYIQRFPELGGPFALPAHLVYEEYRIRVGHGDRPEPDAYISRFPHLAETLRSLFGESQHPTQREEPSVPPTLRMVPNTPTPPAMPDTTLPAVGEYQLLKLLGRGQFGEVWRAIAPGGVEVAIKIINQPADRETARRELQALELVKNLRHPCLMSTLAFWTHQDKVHIVIELADGTLRDQLKESQKNGKGGIAADELIRSFASAADGIDFLHSKQVFHRDIKPDNILLVNGHAKVADFGLARAQERPDMSVSFAGTPVYMAPEVWAGKYRPESDQYSLAMAYAELRLGRRPVDGNDFVELMARQLEKPPDLAGLPPPEKAVLTRALAKQPERRYRSCREFVEALEEAVKPKALPAHGKTFGAWPVIVGVVLLVAMGAAGWAILFRNGDRSTHNGNPETELTVPAGYRAVDSKSFRDIGGRLYATRIERDEIADVKPVFILIVPASDYPFYMLETKVWNGLMAQFVAATAGDQQAMTWRNKSASGAAVGMTVMDASACAKWLGGRLPTPRELDIAAGFTWARPSLIESGKPAVGRSEPRSVTHPDREVAASGVTDLTGNGREWTCEVIGVPDGRRETLPERPGEDMVVVLRGRDYTLATPLTVDDLIHQQQEPQTQFAGKGSRYTGFRVVIPID
jgi:hypothetical protein